MSIKLYLARSMTGRIKEDVVKEARNDKKFFENAGFKVLCPVSEEKVKATKAVLESSKKAMDVYWVRDKQMIREANIVLDMTPDRKSEGVAHEIGYARYHLWKPVIRVYPLGELPAQSSIAYFEDDYLCDSLEEAIEYILRKHGTWFKRLKWRLDVYNRCLIKSLWYKFQEWFK